MLILETFGVMGCVLVFGLDNAIIVRKFVRRLGRWQWIYMFVGPFVIVTMELVFPVTMVTLFSGGGFLSNALEIVRAPHEFAESLDDIEAFTGVFAATFLMLSGAFGLTDKANKKAQRIVRGSAVLALAAAAAVGGIEFGLAFAVVVAAGAGMWAIIRGLQGALPASGSIAQVLLVVEGLEFAFSLDSLAGALTITSDPLVLVGGLLMGAFIARALVRWSIKSEKVKRVLEVPELEFGAFACISILGVAALAGIWANLPSLPTELAGLAILVSAGFVGKVRRS